MLSKNPRFVGLKFSSKKNKFCWSKFLLQNPRFVGLALPLIMLLKIHVFLIENSSWKYFLISLKFILKILTKNHVCWPKHPLPEGGFQNPLFWIWIFLKINFQLSIGILPNIHKNLGIGIRIALKNIFEIPLSVRVLEIFFLYSLLKIS